MDARCFLSARLASKGTCKAAKGELVRAIAKKERRVPQDKLFDLEY